MKRKSNSRGLTEKQRRFIEEYVKDWSLTEAAKRLGCTPGSANQFLKKPAVIAKLDEIRGKIDRETVATAQEVAEYLTRVMRGEETEDALKNVGAGMQKEIKQQVKPKDRLKAAELLGKHYGMFTEKVEVSGQLPMYFVDDIELVDDLGDSRNG